MFCLQYPAFAQFVVGEQLEYLDYRDARWKNGTYLWGDNNGEHYVQTKDTVEEGPYYCWELRRPGEADPTLRTDGIPCGDTTRASDLQKELFCLENLARTQPLKFAKKLKDKYQKGLGDHFGGTTANVIEAIRFLESTSPLLPLIYCQEMSLAAQRRVEDSIQTSEGNLCNLCINGSLDDNAEIIIPNPPPDAESIILRLIVDANDPQRRQRNILFQKGNKATAVLTHTGIGFSEYLLVIAYATNFREYELYQGNCGKYCPCIE